MLRRTHTCVCVCVYQHHYHQNISTDSSPSPLSPPHSHPLPPSRSRPLQSHTTTHGDIKRCERSSKSRRRWQDTRQRRRSPKLGVHRRPRCGQGRRRSSFRKCAAAAPNSTHTHTNRSTAFADDTPAHPQVCVCQKRPSTEVKETYNH
jgi:hypothetical protein